MKSVITAFVMVSALCAADWNPRAAADYLDGRQKEWAAWPVAKAPGGQCISCHTGMTYLMARPVLRRVLGEKQPTPYEAAILDGLRSRADKLDVKEVSPGFSKEPAASQAMGVETIMAALFLHGDNAGRQALDRLWALQNDKGAWGWFSLNLDPWEMPESQFYGASLGAMAVSAAPAKDRNPEKVAALAAYLRAEQSTQPLHNRLMLLWASAGLPEALTKESRKALIEAVWRSQASDGGWSMEALGPWTKHPAAPAAAGSNAYATGFTAFVLEQAGVSRKDKRLVQALDWLKTHQDPTGSWPAESMNKVYPPGSMQIKFMQDAATAFAAMALSASE